MNFGRKDDPKRGEMRKGELNSKWERQEEARNPEKRSS